MKLRDFDLDAFRNYVAERGGVASTPRAGEHYAFRHDGIHGGVSKRVDGQFRMTGLARVYCQDYEAERTAGRKVSASAVRVSLTADQCDLAIALLADAGRASCYVGGCTEGARGGWGVHISAGFTTIEICGGAFKTTAARMEVSAALIALKLMPRGSRVKLIADATHFRRGMQWLDDWHNADWMAFGTDQPISNRDLWESVYRAMTRRVVVIKWLTPQDANIDLKDRAAALARAGLQSIEQWENCDA